MSNVVIVDVPTPPTEVIVSGTIGAPGPRGPQGPPGTGSQNTYVQMLAPTPAAGSGPYIWFVESSDGTTVTDIQFGTA